MVKKFCSEKRFQTSRLVPNSLEIQENIFFFVSAMPFLFMRYSRQHLINSKPNENKLPTYASNVPIFLTQFIRRPIQGLRNIFFLWDLWHWSISQFVEKVKKTFCYTWLVEHTKRRTLPTYCWKSNLFITRLQIVAVWFTEKGINPSIEKGFFIALPPWSYRLTRRNIMLICAGICCLRIPLLLKRGSLTWHTYRAHINARKKIHNRGGLGIMSTQTICDTAWLKKLFPSMLKMELRTSSTLCLTLITLLILLINWSLLSNTHIIDINSLNKVTTN